MNLSSDEIIYALECCLSTYQKECEKCPYYSLQTAYISLHSCDEAMRRDLFDFISKTKSEIVESAFKTIYGYSDVVFGEEAVRVADLNLIKQRIQGDKK